MIDPLYIICAIKIYGVELGSLPKFTKSLVNSTLKFIESTLNDEFKPLKSFYLMNDVSTCENFKVSN